MTCKRKEHGNPFSAHQNWLEASRKHLAEGAAEAACGVYADYSVDRLLLELDEEKDRQSDEPKI